MEAYAPLQELKKRAKGDTNKQRRIKNLLAHQEFVEYFEIVRDAKPDLCSLVSASAEEAWKELNKRYVDMNLEDMATDVFEYDAVARAAEGMALLIKRRREDVHAGRKMKFELKAAKEELEKQEAEIRRLRKLELNFPVEKIEAVSKATDKVLEERKKVEDEWANVVKDMREVHQREVGQLQFVMGLQTKKIKELRASGGG